MHSVRSCGSDRSTAWLPDGRPRVHVPARVAPVLDLGDPFAQGVALKVERLKRPGILSVADQRGWVPFVRKTCQTVP